MQGPITVLAEGSYAGDASIEDLPPTQQRLISYGVDQEVTVRTDNNTQNNTLLTGKIVKGVLELTYKQQMSVDYIAEDKSENPRVATHRIPPPRRLGFDRAQDRDRNHRFALPIRRKA